VLTAIVITFGMTAFVVILSLRSFLETGSDHVDGDKVPCDAQDGMAGSIAEDGDDTRP
jgi:multicomponent K+:H+ antiporter subunit C